MALSIKEIETDEQLRSFKIPQDKRFPFLLLEENVNDYREGTINWHWHSEFEFLYVKNNSIVCQTEGERIRIRSGEGLFINSKTVHCLKADGESSISVVLFSPRAIADVNSVIYEDYVLPVLSSSCRTFFLTPEISWQKQLLTIHGRDIPAASREMKSEHNIKELNIHFFVLNMWVLMVRHAWEDISRRSDRKLHAQHLRMYEMLEFIEQHYSENISVADIARAASVSKSEAQRCFRQFMETSPIRFLNEYRLNEADHLLRTTDLPVSSIALDVGFESISYFDRKYRQLFGMSPSGRRRNGDLPID